MDFISNNIYILTPVTLLFLLAVINGFISKKLMKFCSAYLNVIGILFLLYGLFYLVNQYAFDATSEMVEKANSTNEEILSSDFLITPNFVDINHSIDQAFIFLDFSGSVKTETLLERVRSMEKVFDNIDEKRFFFFGSCTHEIEDVTNLTIEEIDNIKSESCNNNNERIRSYTDIVYMLEELEKIIQNNANDKTICIFITDDIQSTRKTSNDLDTRLSSIKNVYENFVNKGVVFQLMKTPGAKRNVIMSADSMNHIFNGTNLIESISMEKNLQNILKNRFLTNDFIPLQTKTDSVMNNKITFDIINFQSNKKGLNAIELKITNHYTSFTPVIKIDSIISEHWQAFNFSEKWNTNYVRIPPDTEESIILPFKLENNFGLTFFNSSNSSNAKIYYEVIIPGSQQVSYHTLLDENNYYEELKDETFKGLYAGNFFSSTSVKVNRKIDVWMYFIYALIAFILSFIVIKLTKPTLLGREFMITNKSNDSLLVNKSFKNVKEYHWEDGNKLFSIDLKSYKVRRRPFNLFKQPEDWYTLKIPEFSHSTTTKKSTSLDIADYHIQIR